MATTAMTDETPIKIPRTVRNERSLFAFRDWKAIRMASVNGTAASLV
jgi:hypothetical protein